MQPETGQALLILVLFVLPGFVAVLVSERTHEIPHRRPPFELLLRAAYYSVLSYSVVALLTWPTGVSRSDIENTVESENLGRLATLLLFVVVIVPSSLALIGRLWHRSRIRLGVLRALRIHETHAVTSAWNDHFRRARPALVRVRLSDGKWVAGVYGAESFAAYSEDGGDLLLQEMWDLDDDDWFTARRAQSQAVWIPANEIIRAEFYDVTRDDRVANDSPSATS